MRHATAVHQTHTQLYAPMSSLGGVLFDRDATYIDLGGSHYLSTKRAQPGQSRSAGAASQAATAVEHIHSAFADLGQGLDEQLEREHRVRMIEDAPYLLSQNVRDDDDDETGSTDEDQQQQQSMDDTDGDGDASEQSDVPMNDEQSDGEADDAEMKEVELFSGVPVAGFLVPAGSQLNDDQTPMNVVPSQQLKTSVHMNLKRLFDGTYCEGQLSLR